MTKKKFNIFEAEENWILPSFAHNKSWCCIHPHMIGFQNGSCSDEQRLNYCLWILFQSHICIFLILVTWWLERSYISLKLERIEYSLLFHIINHDVAFILICSDFKMGHDFEHKGWITAYGFYINRTPIFFKNFGTRWLERSSISMKYERIEYSLLLHKINHDVAFILLSSDFKMGHDFRNKGCITANGFYINRTFVLLRILLTR